MRVRIYVKRSEIITYLVDADSVEAGAAMAKKHLETAYYLSDSTTDKDGEEVESPFEYWDADSDSQEEFVDAEED